MTKQPKQSPTDFLEMPDLDVLRGILAGDGTISAREQTELKAAVRVLAAIDFDSPTTPLMSGGFVCINCDTHLEGPSETLTQRECLCPSCTFWEITARLAKERGTEETLEACGSIRWAGLHYTLQPWGDPGPVMTVRFHGGLTIVSGRLRCQGAIPRRYLLDLPDNAVIFEGDPQGKGIGIFHV